MSMLNVKCFFRVFTDSDEQIVKKKSFFSKFKFLFIIIVCKIGLGFRAGIYRDAY